MPVWREGTSRPLWRLSFRGGKRLRVLGGGAAALYDRDEKRVGAREHCPV